MESTTLQTYIQVSNQNIESIPELMRSSSDIPLAALFMSLLTGKIKFAPDMQNLKETSLSKSLCAKSLRGKDIAWKCEDCEKDTTCIICNDCYEAGDHKGH